MQGQSHLPLSVLLSNSQIRRVIPVGSQNRLYHLALEIAHTLLSSIKQLGRSRNEELDESLILEASWRWNQHRTW
jgi:hypothetical protein